mmetsp:Transcript_70912/g.148334  ORF Transcript_70912/g.148334 Transcript_70912/m.148334 type:complete len:297 (-) Transcript_70912:788-1678(-)
MFNLRNRMQVLDQVGHRNFIEAVYQDRIDGRKEVGVEMVDLGEGVDDVDEQLGARSGQRHGLQTRPPKVGGGTSLEERAVADLQLPEGHVQDLKLGQRGLVQPGVVGPLDQRGGPVREHLAAHASLGQGSDDLAQRGDVHEVEAAPGLDGQEVEQRRVLAGELCEAIEGIRQLRRLEILPNSPLPKPVSNGVHEMLVMDAALREALDRDGAVLGRELLGILREDAADACEQAGRLSVAPHAEQDVALQDLAQLRDSEEGKMLRDHPHDGLQEVFRRPKSAAGLHELRQMKVGGRQA